MLRFLLLFLFCLQRIHAQDADTLLTQILHTEADTEKVNLLYTYGLDLTDKNPQLAFQFANNCSRIAKRTNSLKHIAKSDNLLGIFYTKNGNYKKALPYFENYLAISKSLNSGIGMAISCTNLGNVYLRLRDYRKAEDYFLSSVAYYNVLNNKKEIANGLINIGVVKHQQRYLEAAMEHYQKALVIGQDLNDYEIREICLNNLAQLYSDKGELEKAMAYNYDALELRELMGLEVNVADSYLSIAEIALKQKDQKPAEENLNLAKLLCNKLDYLEGKSLCYKLLAELYALRNDHKAAFENLTLYNRLNDSLNALHSEEPETTFTEVQYRETIAVKAGYKNGWLFILVSLLLIIIPFVLIRNKR